MKNLLVLLGFLFILVGCTYEAKDVTGRLIKNGDKVMLVKECVSNYDDLILKAGEKAIVVRSGSDTNYVRLAFYDGKEGDALYRTNECLKIIYNNQTENKDLNLPKESSQNVVELVTKKEALKEYIELQKVCDKYNRLFKTKGVIDIENDPLKCNGLTKEELQREIEIVEKYLENNKDK